MIDGLSNRDVDKLSTAQTSLVPMNGNGEIKIVEAFDDVWISIQDLAKSWGYDKWSLKKHLTRNPTVFEGCFYEGDKLSQHDSDTYINEQGLYILLGRVNTGKLKPEMQTALNDFRKRVPVILKDHRRGQIVHQTVALPEDPVLGSLSRNAKYRKHLIEQYDFEPKEATAITLALVQKETGVSFESAVPSVISRSSGDWCNPTDLGRECGLTPHQVNMWLYNNKLQYPTKDGQETIWRLTKEGEEFGEEFVFEISNRHSEIRIRWHQSVKDAYPGLKRVNSEVAPIIIAP